MTDKLKPCPFCGGNNAQIKHCNHDVGMLGKIEYVYVQCQDCNATGSKADDWNDSHNALIHGKTLEDIAIEAWNRRADND